MDLVAHELTPPSARVDEREMEAPNGVMLPSPLAEITAETTARARRSKPAPRRKPRPRRRSIAPGEVIVGSLVGINDDGQPLVRHPLDPSDRLCLARTTVPVTVEHVDRQVVLAFESGDITRPIVLGLLLRADGTEPAEQNVVSPKVVQPIVQATLDGEQLVLTAQHEIVLRCGKASLTLTRAGKILLRGTYLLSRSSGVNRIKGGSVQIN